MTWRRAAASSSLSAGEAVTEDVLGGVEGSAGDVVEDEVVEGDVEGGRTEYA